MRYLMFFLIFTSVCNSQVLVEKEVNKTKTDVFFSSKLDNIFTDNDETYYSQIQKESVNNTLNTVDRVFTIKSSAGKRISLNANEYPIEILKDKLFTFVEDVANHERKYVVYDLKKNQLIKKSHTILSPSSSIEILESGDLILREGNHSGFEWIGIYTNDFKEIQRFKPFNTESWIASSSNDDYIFFAAQIDRDTKIRMALYYAFGSKNLIDSKQIDIEADHILSNVKVFENKVAMLFSSMKDSSTYILVLDNKLKIINKISFNERISYNKVLNVGNDIFVNTTSAIYSYDIYNGMQNWKIVKKTPILKTINQNQRFKVTNLYDLNDRNIILTEATLEPDNEEFIDLTIKIIDVKTNDVVQTLKTKKTFKGNIVYKNFKKEIMFYSNNNILSYEKL